MNHIALAAVALDNAADLINSHTAEIPFQSEPIRAALQEARKHVSSMPDKAEAKEHMITIVAALCDLPVGTVGPAKLALGGLCKSLGFTPYSFCTNGTPFEWIVPGSPGSDSYIAFLAFSRKYTSAIMEAAVRLSALGELVWPGMPEPVSLTPGEATALLLEKMGVGYTESYCRKLASTELKKPWARTADGKRVLRTAVIKLAQEKASKAAERDDLALEKMRGKRGESITCS